MLRRAELRALSAISRRELHRAQADERLRFFDKRRKLHRGQRKLCQLLAPVRRHPDPAITVVSDVAGVPGHISLPSDMKPAGTNRGQFTLDLRDLAADGPCQWRLHSVTRSE